MPYIDMCPGGNCPMRGKCYRYTAIPIENQRHFLLAPYKKILKHCDHFWNNEGKENMDIKQQKKYRRDMLTKLRNLWGFKR